MSLSRHITVATLIAITASGCGGRRAATQSTAEAIAEGRDFLSEVPSASVPASSMGGQTILIVRVGGVALSDSAGRFSAGPPAGLDRHAGGALDSALRRAAPEVEWRGLAEQQAAARRSPTLGLNPATLPSNVLLLEQERDRVPAPLLTPLRLMAGVLGARYALVPPVVRLASEPDGFRATYLLVLVDTRMGVEVWRARSDGPVRPTAVDAITAAAAAAAGAP